MNAIVLDTIEFWLESDENRHQFLATWKEFLAKCEIYHSSTSLIRRAVSLAIHLVKRTGLKPRKHWSDIWIAATALELGIPLVTNNVKDFKKFEELGLRIFSPEA
ncbi:MAG: type II toxin-antitoxin system VapC family toxin [candidate division WOR-3 bacterium]